MEGRVLVRGVERPYPFDNWWRHECVFPYSVQGSSKGLDFSRNPGWEKQYEWNTFLNGGGRNQRKFAEIVVFFTKYSDFFWVGDA